MRKWPYAILYHSSAEIQEHCVQNPAWQKVRLGLKGLPTEQKLIKLYEWYFNQAKHTHTQESYIARVCVDNYINALKRGGQLNDKCEVQR